MRQSLQNLMVISEWQNGKKLLCLTALLLLNTSSVFNDLFFVFIIFIHFIILIIQDFKLKQIGIS